MVENTLVQNENKGKKKGLTDYFARIDVQNQIKQVVGSNSSRFVGAVISATQGNMQLQECTKGSILSAALLGEGLNLSPSPQLGQYYLVPFRKKAKYDNKGNLISAEKLEAQFQLGYKGYIQLAIRSGCYKRLNALVIKEGELKHYDPISEEIEVNFIEDENIRDKTPTLGYCAMFEYNNGFRKVIYWSKQKMLAHADRYSQAFNKATLERIEAGEIAERDMWKYSSFWYKDFDGMALKTMLRQLISKWGVMSIEMQTAIEKDMAVIKEDGSPEYVEAPQSEEIEEVQTQEIQNCEVQETPQSFFD